MLIEHVERLVERFYARVQISPETTQALASMLPAKFDQMMSEGAADADVQADALTWAAEAKKEGQVRTSSKGGSLGGSSHLTRLG